MCTSFTYQMEDGSNALARTMDFSFILDPDAIFIPRGYTWDTHVADSAHTVRYAFAGLGRHDKSFLFADGVNEEGLGCAALYFPGFATYHQDAVEGKTNLAPHEVVMWMLSSFASVSEVRTAIQELNLIDGDIDFLGIVVPLHWIITDKAGETIVVEPLQDGIVVHDNPIGVMSNSPDFTWHTTNIRNYIGVKPHQPSSIQLGGMTFAPFGQGAGTMGLPGDYTPPSRFLRVLFGKETIGHAQHEIDAVTAMFHLLASVDIPKGSVLTDRGADYTQYSCVMLCDRGTYYFKTYDNNQICKIDLHAENMDASEPKVWSIPKDQQIRNINK